MTTLVWVLHKQFTQQFTNKHITATHCRIILRCRLKARDIAHGMGFSLDRATSLLHWHNLGNADLCTNMLQAAKVQGVCSGLRRGTHYRHLCDRWTRHYKRFSANWRRICSISNCSGTSATLTDAAVADTVSVTANIYSDLIT